MFDVDDLDRMASRKNRETAAPSPGRRAATRFAAAVAALVVTASPAAAATITVANNGTDGPACGTKANPCRSITQGVALAVDGDRVSVGPGIYGDIDGNGALGGVGEEPGATCGSSACMIKIEKAVDVVSEAGAFSTLIRPPVGAVYYVVAFTPPAPATFGGKGRGFTIDSAGSDMAIAAGGAEAGVAGNVVLASGTLGIAFAGPGGIIAGNRVLCPSGSPTIGMLVSSTPASTLSDNAVLGCDIGILGFGDMDLASAVLVGNGIGVGLDGTSTAMGILAAGNTYAGIVVDSAADSISIRESSVLGNGDGAANCGIDATSTASTVADVWYGAPTGPGPDPADLLCNAGSVPSPTFADKPVKVKLKPIR